MTIFKKHDIFLCYHLYNKDKNDPRSSYLKALELKELLEKQGFNCYLLDPESSVQAYKETVKEVRNSTCFLLVINNGIIEKCQNLGKDEATGEIHYSLKEDTRCHEEIEAFVKKYLTSVIAHNWAMCYCDCSQEDFSDRQISLLRDDMLFDCQNYSRDWDRLLEWAKAKKQEAEEKERLEAEKAEKKRQEEEEAKRKKEEAERKRREEILLQQQTLRVKPKQDDTADAFKDFIYQIANNELTIVKYVGNSTKVVIPESVTRIGEKAFNYCHSLTSMVISDSVTSIGNYAFSGCSSLTSITIPSSVTSIGDCAFSGCSSLTSITIPSSVTSIGDWAFSVCSSLTSVTIPSSVTSIGDSAFRDCSSLTSVTIPSSVTSIGESAFYECNSLTGVYISDIASWCAIDFGNYSANPLCYANKLYLNNQLVSDLVIPSGVTSVGRCAFSGCSSLTSIVIPSSVTSIGYSAFRDCSSLTSIVIPSSVTSIGFNAFSECSSLTSVVIPSSVTSIGSSAFSGCSSLTIYLEAKGKPSGWTSNWNHSYRPVVWNCTEHGVTDDGIKWGLTKDGIMTVAGYSGESTQLVIPYTIEGYSVTSIGYSAFRDCSSLTSVTIPSSVTSIGNYAFEDCSSLTSIEIPSSVTSIGDCAFYGCSSLTSVVIPSSVTSIGGCAFERCSTMLIIYCQKRKPILWKRHYGLRGLKYIKKKIRWGYKGK